MKVVAIVGSPHAQGNTSYLTDVALQELSVKGIDTEKFVLGQYTIGPCLAHEGCSTFTICKVKDDTPGIIEKFNQADGVILASPVYFWDVTAQMKTFIDRNFFNPPTRARRKLNTPALSLSGAAGARMKRLLL